MTQVTSAPPPSQPKTHGLAIASLICGILGLVCCGLVAAVPAVICGHIGLGKIRAAPGQFSGEGLAKAGLILGYIGIVVSIVVIILYAIGFFAAVAIQ